MNPDEMVAVFTEIGRLSLKLNLGFGKGLLQKDQPLQLENGIKMNHLHFHIAPRFETDVGLFPVPDPNSFESFVVPTDAEIAEVLERTRQPHPIQLR